MMTKKRQLSQDDTEVESKMLRTKYEDANVYLSTINRKYLDFDFEKVCSVTLSNVNIYGCLVCGKYFQGRGKSSPAVLHAIDEDHHIFINFTTLKSYILPENKLVSSSTLKDIEYAIYPQYTKAEISQLRSQSCTDLNGNSYKPGFIGLNNIKANDYMNVILQAIAHTRIIQENLLLVQNNDTDDIISRKELNKRFTTFVKKLWSPKLFKNHISPHDVLQHIGILSNKQFTMNEQKDPKDFLLWLLNTLHRYFLVDKSKSIISNSFQGRLRIQSQKLSTTETENQQVEFRRNEDVTETSTKFWILTLDLPSPSFFKDGSNVDEIPQIQLRKLMEKYTGEKEQILPTEIRRYTIDKFPPYLILHFNRFQDPKLDIKLTNKERNQTIVEFPLEMTFRNDTVKYRLKSNIVHQSIQNSVNLKDDNQSVWAIQLRRNEEWFEIEDLNIKKKEKEFLFLSESYIQVWERLK